MRTLGWKGEVRSPKSLCAYLPELARSVQVAPGLFMGSAPPVGLPYHALNLRGLVLAAEEYQPKISLFSTFEMVFQVNLPRWGLPKSADEQLMKWSRLLFAQWMLGPLLVTSAQGKNRAALFCGALLMLSGRCSDAAEALQVLRERGGSAVLARPDLREALFRLQEEIAVAQEEA